MNFFTKNRVAVSIALLVASVAVGAVAGIDFYSFRNYSEQIMPGPGVTDSYKLSHFFDGIAGTFGDTDVYVLEGKGEGGSMLVLGGTHPNEPAGHMAAVALIETALVEAGTLYVIPRANNSAFTHNDSQEAAPHFYHLTTKSGARAFPYGSRATNPLDQWPDPDVYVHASSGQSLSGSETRNLNRGYPGVPDGTLTEQVCYAITNMIRELSIDVTIDLHEASPEYPTINAIVAHDRAMDLASWALLEMQLKGVDISLEPSPVSLRGLTHRELGDHTDTLAILMETGNASQGRLRGRTDEALALTGIDKFYESAAKLGYLYIPYDETGVSIEERVGRHLEGIVECAGAYELLYGSAISITGVPTYQQLMEPGASLGDFLN